LIVFLPAKAIEFHLVLFNLLKCSKSLNNWNVFGFSHISLLLHRKYALEDEDLSSEK